MKLALGYSHPPGFPQSILTTADTLLTRPDPDTLPGSPGWSRLVESHYKTYREYAMEPHLRKK